MNRDEKEKLRKAIEELHKIAVDLPQSEAKKKLLDRLQKMTEDFIRVP